MDVTRILSRQPLARGAAFYISCLPTSPIVTTGSVGTHPRDGTTVHLSKNASQLLLAARCGPHRPLNRQEGKVYSFSTASQSSVCNFGRFFSAAFPPLSAAADSSPAAALPQTGTKSRILRHSGSLLGKGRLPGRLIRPCQWARNRPAIRQAIGKYSSRAAKCQADSGFFEKSLWLLARRFFA
jgi:hypothetical protein